MGTELNYPRQFMGSQDYEVYEIDLSTARTDIPLPQAVGLGEEELPFDATCINIIRNDAPDWEVKIKLDDTSKKPIPLPSISPPMTWMIHYATRKVYITNPAISGAYLYIVVFA